MHIIFLNVLYGMKEGYMRFMKKEDNFSKSVGNEGRKIKEILEEKVFSLGLNICRLGKR